MGGAKGGDGKPSGADEVYAQCIPRSSHSRENGNGDLCALRQSKQERKRFLGGQHKVA